VLLRLVFFADIDSLGIQNRSSYGVEIIIQFKNFRVEGNILIDGVDIYRPDTDLYALRRKVGLIFQKPYVFPKNILTMLFLESKRSCPRRSSHTW
jgi:ABC-type phosphate transport system ATPase subunit